MILVILLHALFALTFPLAKIAVSSSEPLFFTGVRMILGGSLLLAYQYYRDKKVFFDVKKYWSYIVGLAFFNVFLTNATEYWSLKYLTSAKASFIYSICPFISAILSYFLFSEKITKKKLLGMAIGATGFLLILLNDTHLEEQSGSMWFLSWAELVMIVAAFATVYGWIIMRQLINKSPSSLLAANGYSMVLGSIFSFVASYFFDNQKALIVDSQNFLLSLFSIVFLSNIVCYNLYAYLLKKYTATFISFVGFIEPLFAAFYGYLLLGETISSQFFLASLIVLIGLYVFYSEELRQGYIASN
ncbi:DMT family transporter [Candidatus Babela massiliensis]|uniref:DMT superfamily transporter n=1 Tax=Candidatus Babela massiliensis TaxID=673862 RepID=V6DIH9_9BACT|nr:DMT family transporter [Candidatus Babela massiliensis]CDK30733.1 DMT superfamily transporter [Candidatus Babela massiliensis]